MPRVLIVTTMNEQIAGAYGRRMMQSVVEQMGPGVRLRLYAEMGAPHLCAPDLRWVLEGDWVAPAAQAGRLEIEPLEYAAPWLPEFKAWCEGDPIRQGWVERGGGRPPLYDFRMDARRFAHKVAAITHACLERPGGAGLIVWMDADCVAHGSIPADWWEGLIPEGRALAWLDRVGLYPECGVLVTRPGAKGFHALWAGVRKLYVDRDLVHHREWHDSYLIQQVAERLAAHGLMEPPASLSGDARRHSHPLVNGPLGARLDHLKGPRKQEGRSRPGDLMRPRAEPYWQGHRS